MIDRHAIGTWLATAVVLCGVMLSTPNWCQAKVFTLWPAVDFRSDDESGYSNLALAGPLIKYERKTTEHSFGLRPFFYHLEQPQSGSVYNDFLYPLATWQKGGEESGFQLLHLLTYDFGSRESGSKNEFTLFPFIFYGNRSEDERFFAFFPLGGTIRNKYGRDRIDFALFPLYSQTTRGTTVTTNIVWPVFSLIVGPQESGWSLWPLFGQSEKQGVYRKRFALWPIFYAQDLNLDTPEPRRVRAIFPFAIWEDAPHFSSHTYLWPFFSHIEDGVNNYEEWNFPWPLLRIARGDYKYSNRFLPLFEDERIGANRKRWFLWPLYKIEETETEKFYRRRDRAVFFVYSNLTEQVIGEDEPRLRRVALWPFFTYERKDGMAHFYALSLLEPFFPDNERIARNWSPLWRLYQVKWDNAGGEVSSLLWNLYWKERRGERLAFEIFPLIEYRRESRDDIEIKILKGLIGYHRHGASRELKLLFLPWEIGWRDASRPSGVTQ